MLIVAYVLMVLGFSVTSRADVSILPFPHQNNSRVVSLEGQVVATLDATYYLIVSEEIFFEITSNDIDLEQFNGLKVKVQAFESFKRVGPVLSLQTIDPLHGQIEKKPAPLLIVLGISEIQD